MSTISYCDDLADVGSIAGEADGDAAIICDSATDVFTIQRYIAAWAQVIIGGGTSPGALTRAMYRYSTADGVDGGDNAQDAWTNYPLSDEDIDTITIAFNDGADQLDTVPAGEYEIYGLVCFNDIARGRVLLYDVTSSTYMDDVYSLSMRARGGDHNDKHYFSGRFTLSVDSSIEVRYYAEDQNVGDGLGDGASLGSLEEYFGNFELRQIEAY